MNDFIIPNWPAPKNVKSLVTTRFGGVSKSPFVEFNLADHVGDEPSDVAKNRQILQKHLPAEPVWLRQTHSKNVIKADSYCNTTNTDASCTSESNVVCVVLTADCLPVLFTNTSGTIVAAAHAGWRGLAAGILEETVSKISKNPEQIMVWFGPAIGAKSFEVGDEVKQIFIQKNSKTKSAFVAMANNKFLANIYQIATIRLNDIGVVKVFGDNFDTYTDNRFYSFRRQNITGRMASLIWLGN